jgi:outer membrane receptor protein involved in Fe transport
MRRAVPRTVPAQMRMDRQHVQEETMTSRVFGLTIRLFVSITILLAGYNILQAQSIEHGKITGQITDNTGQPIPGATVEITSNALISGNRVTTSSENGTYVFLSLPLGTYKVTASLTGFKTEIRDMIPISGGTTATVNLSMQFGEVTESVTVSAENVIVDTKTSTIDVKLNEKFINQIPTTRDAFYDLTLTAPGLTSQGKDGAWLPSPTVYGSASSENVFLLNGVNTTDPRGGAWGSQVKVNFDTVEEVRVIDLGAKAEYGSATGAAIDVVTKSGGNQLSGSVSAFSQLGNPANNQPSVGDNLGRDWITLDPSQDLVSKTETDREFSFTMGGPIVKDKVWFYTAADYTKNDLKKPLWPVILDSKNKFFDAKVSAQLMKNQSAWLSYHFERNNTLGDTWGDNVPWDSQLQFGSDENINTISTQWQAFPSSQSLFTVKYLGYWTKQDPTLPSNAPAYPGYINWWKWQEFGVNGHFPYIEAHDSSRHTLQGDMTKYVEHFLGQQDLKFGVQYTTGHGNELGGYFLGYANFAYPYRWTQDIAYTKEAYGDTGMLWYVNQVSLPPFETVREYRQAGAFFDDQWTLSPRLTLNLGLRFDHMTNNYGTGKVFEQPASLEDVTNLQVVRERQGSGNIFDFNDWSPRVGATYAVTNDGKTVVRGNYGRYYMPVGLENLRRFGPDMPLSDTKTLFLSVPWDEVDTNNNGIIDPNEVTATARLLHGLQPYDQTSAVTDYSWEAQVADGTKNQFTDLLTLNFEREIFHGFSFATSFIYKHTGNILVNWPINRTTGQAWEYERKPYTTQHGQNVNLYSIVWKDYNQDGVIDLNDVAWISQNNSYEVRNLPSLDGQDPSRNYKGLQFTLTKRFSTRMQMMGSFLYSDSNGPANRNNFQDWNIEGPMIMDTGSYSSLNNSINNFEGPLPFTPKYEVKLTGFYTIPHIETNFGARVRYNSGRPYWFLEEIPVISQYSDPENLPPDGVIDVGTPIIVGVDPNNPVFLPATTIFDLQLQKDFNIGGRQLIGVSFDVFNLFNNNNVANVDYQNIYGQATAVTSPSRKFRLGLSYQF